MKTLFIALVVMCFSCSGVAYLSTDYNWQEYNGHKYAFTIDVGTWEEAESEAAVLGGHLVTINDATENNWIVLNLQGYEDMHLWIGLYQDFDDPLFSEPDGGWKWINGEPITFTNFGGANPDNAHGGQHYGTLFPVNNVYNRLWDDWGPEGAYYPTYGIIEIPEPTTLLLLGLGGLLIKRQ